MIRKRRRTLIGKKRKKKRNRRNMTRNRKILIFSRKSLDTLRRLQYSTSMVDTMTHSKPSQKQLISLKNKVKIKRTQKNN